MVDCCVHTHRHKSCIRKSDGKKFNLPRKMSFETCINTKRKGFTMKSSCAVYNDCKTGAFPKHYLAKLSKTDRRKQLAGLLKSKKDYKKGKYTLREPLKSYNYKKSKHIVDFEKKYNVNITDFKRIEQVTKIPVKVQKKVVNKGMGAYYSGGSRPNQTPHSWGYARLASFLLKRNAYKIDKHLLTEL